MIVGMFLPPDLPKVLSDGIFKGNKQLALILLGLGFAFLVVLCSGLWSAVFCPNCDLTSGISNDIFITIVVIIILIVPFLLIMWPTKVEKKEEIKP
jgi:tetrahydromethanopterin S-methyltransferase subunit E